MMDSVMKSTANVLGAAGGAMGKEVLSNPVVAGALLVAVGVYGLFKAGEGAVEAAPALYEGVVNAASNAYAAARDEVLAIIHGNTDAIADPVETV